MCSRRSYCWDHSSRVAAPRNPDMLQDTTLNGPPCRQIALLALLRSWTSCDRCRSSAEARVCTQPCNKFMASAYRGLMTSTKPIVTSGTRQSLHVFLMPSRPCHVLTKAHTRQPLCNATVNTCLLTCVSGRHDGTKSLPCHPQDTFKILDYCVAWWLRTWRKATCASLGMPRGPIRA